MDEGNNIGSKALIRFIMLNAPIIGALLADMPSPSLQDLQVLFPDQLPACEAFINAASLPDFFSKIGNADFNTLEQYSMALTNMGVPYNLAMPALTTWRSALANQVPQGALSLLTLLKEERWEELKTLDNPIFLRYTALAKMKTGDFAGALAGFTEVLALEPQNTSILTNVARCHFNCGDALAAVDAFEKAIMFDNSLEATLLPALREARSAAEASMASLPAEYWLAYMEKLAATQQMEQLGKIAQQMLQKSDFPQAEAHFYMGLAFTSQYNFKEAIVQFDKAIVLKENHLFYTSRGIAKYNSNKAKDAAKDFQKALQLNEEDDQARQYLMNC